MKGIWRKLTSLFLALILTLQLLPVQALAAEANSDATKENLGAVSSESQDATPNDATIVAEIPEGRDKFQKEFRLSNGMNMISIYGSAVHYEEDGEWKEIDNTLRPVSSTGETLSGKLALTSAAAYTNTAGMWDVKLPASLDAAKAVEVSRDGYTLSFQFAGEIHNNHVVMGLEDELSTATFDVTESLAANVQDITANMGASVTQISTANAVILEPSALAEGSPQQSQSDKLYSALQYSDIYANTDLRYDLQSNQLKESVIIKSAKDTLAGYKYILSAPNMVLELQDDNSIHVYAANAAEGDEPLFYMPAPFLRDDNRVHNDDITVSLQRSGDTYTLTYSLPRAWLLEEERAYPVVLDPVIRPESGIYTISDQTVWSDATTSYTWGCVAVGYTPSQGKARTLIKFRNLPELTSADIIVGATLSLYLVEYDTAVTMEAHQVLTEWESHSVTWSDVDEADVEWNSVVEDYQIITDPTWYTWDITNIAQGWYADGYNSGVFFKASDVYENITTHETREFYSSDWGGSVTPVLHIMYLNNSGLEDIWDYTSQSAGRAGTGHVNNFTGNLVWVHDGLSFSGNRMPVSISHVYNANDKDHKGHNDNDYGMGYGWRTNYNQHVYSWTSPGDNPTTYYVWVDQDGTRRYFNYSSSGTYKNEIDNTLVLTTTGSGDEKYCITDKDGNKSYFDTSGRLKKILNNQETPSIITITYTSSSSKRITSITDGSGETNTASRTATGGRKYIFTYTDGKLSRIAFQGTGNTDLSYLTYEYDNSDNLTKITYPDGEFVSYYYSEDPGKHLLYRATDVGGYSVHYSYTEHSPYRVASITESDVDEGGNVVNGGSLAIQYAHNETTFTDHNENKEIVQFNNYGSTVSIQDGLGRAQFAQYADGSENARSASQLTLSSKLITTPVTAEASDIAEDFEQENGWTESPNNASTGIYQYSSYSHSGDSSLEIERWENDTFFAMQSEAYSIYPGQTCTLSGYIKLLDAYGTGSGACIALRLSSSNQIVATSSSYNTIRNWTYLETSYQHPSSAEADSIIICLINKSRGSSFFDDISLERSSVTDGNNLVINGDFNKSTNSWSKNSSCSSNDTVADDTTSADLLKSAAPQLDTSAYRITGSATSSKTVSQTITLSGSKGDVFTLAGWGKGASVPLIDAKYGDDRGRKFGLSVTFIGSDGDGKEHLVSFNPDSDSENNWQYIATRVVADKAYTSVRVSLLYCKNMNVAYFDGIQLYKEEFGQSYVYDEDTGLVTSVIDLQQKKTTYEYENNQLTAIIEQGTSPKTIAEYEYDDYNNVTKATAEDDTITYFAYDTYGNNTAVAVSDDPGLEFIEDEENGNPYSATTSVGKQAIASFAEYTPDGNYLETVTDALGNVTQYTYNPQTGVLLSTVAPHSANENAADYTTNYDHDPLLFRTESVKSGSSTVAYGYGCLHICTASCTDPCSHVCSDTCDPDGADLLRAIVSASETQYSFNYDVFDLLQSVKIGSQTLISHEYSNDENRYLTKSTYGNGHTISYSYDDYGRTTAKTYKDGSGDTTEDVVEYTYDNRGNLGLMTDSATGRTTKYLYDFQDRLSRYEELGPGYSNSVEWVYNTDNNLTSQTQTLNGTTYTTEYSYDDYSRLTENSQDDLAYAYTYDTLGRMARVEETFNGTTAITTEIGYKKPSATLTSPQVETWTHTANNRSLQYSYTYDGRGNITSVSGNGFLMVEYYYDFLDQLIFEKNYFADKSWGYTYDEGGNILTKVEFPSATATDDGVTIDYTYGDTSWKDLLTSCNNQELDYDGVGNLEDDGTWTYTWEHGRQLASMSKSGMNIAYTYSADGLRTSKNVNGTVYNYYYLGDQLVEMTWGDNKMTFIYDAIGPAALTYNGNTYYYTRNAQGDILGIINIYGLPIADYVYDAWGNHLEVEGATSSIVGDSNPLRYRGYIYDTETGLYYLQSRYYNPAWGRFINADTIEVLAISPNSANWDKNLYSYCDNNPINRVDYTGEDWKYLSMFGEGLLNCALVAAGFAIASIGVLALTVSTGGVGTVALASSLLISAKAFALTSAGLAILGTTVLVAADDGNSAISESGAYDPDPYKRPGQKKQGRERKEKKRQENWNPNPNKRIKPLPKHTPGRTHRKY